MKAFKHNCSERNSPQLKALISEAGIVSYGVYWYFLEELNDGNNIEMTNNVLKSLAYIFKISIEDLNAIIEIMVKHELFFKSKGKLINEKTLENARKRSEAGTIGSETRWRGKDNTVIENKAKVEKIIKQALDIKQEEPEDDLPDIGTLYKDEFINPVTPVKVEKKKPLRKPVIHSDFKDWNFLGLFNEKKLELKPKSKGHTVLTATDKANFKKLITLGYGKEDFEKVIKTAFSNKWVQENGMDTPNHILRNDNFTRYLNQSESEESNNLIINESDEPVFN